MVLAVATDFIEFCRQLLFLAVYWLQSKEGEYIDDRLVLLPTVTIFRIYMSYIYISSQGRKMEHLMSLRKTE